MSDAIRAAARKEADLAIELVDGFGHASINALGVLRHPPTYLLALKSARAAIDYHASRVDPVAEQRRRTRPGASSASRHRAFCDR